MLLHAGAVLVLVLCWAGAVLGWCWLAAATAVGGRCRCSSAAACQRRAWGAGARACGCLANGSVPAREPLCLLCCLSRSKGRWSWKKWGERRRSVATPGSAGRNAAWPPKACGAARAAAPAPALLRRALRRQHAQHLLHLCPVPHPAGSRSAACSRSAGGAAAPTRRPPAAASSSSQAQPSHATTAQQQQRQQS